MKSILLFGGNSDERLVSVASAQNLSRVYSFSEIWFMDFDGKIFKTSKQELANHQNPFTVAFQSVGPVVSDSLEGALPALKDAVVYMGFHGTQGEDGKIQSLFESKRILFTGSGARASYLAFDKALAKEVAQKAGLPMASGQVLSVDQKASWGQMILEFSKKHPQFVAKPVAAGSSFGLFIIKSSRDLDQALPQIQNAPYAAYLLEEFLEGRELTVGVYDQPMTPGGARALPPSEVVLDAGASFDYQGKYLGRGTKEITPAQLASQETLSAQELAIKAHEAFGCLGYSRTDMILTSKGPYFLETNTLPGMTKASFIPQQLEAAGLDLQYFLELQIEIGKSRYRKE